MKTVSVFAPVTAGKQSKEFRRVSSSREYLAAASIVVSESP
jgi:hypothetical protein